MLSVRDNMGRKPNKNLNLPPHLRARLKSSGKVYYYYDTGGRPRKEIPLGNDYALAVKRWAELEINTKSRHEEFITFHYVATKYQQDVLPTKALRTQRDNLKELAKLYEFFDHPPAPLDEIRPINIRQFLDWRVNNVQNKLREKNRPIQGNEGQVRANREKALFSHIWNYARERGYTEKSNPCLGIRSYRESGRSNIYVDDAMFEAVREKADQPLRDAMDLAYLTGQRPADTLKFNEHDIRDGALWITQNKTGKKLRIAVQGDLVTAINRIRARKRSYKIISTFLIVNEKGERLTANALRFRFDAARKAAGISKQDFQFRDLRAKAGTDKERESGILEAQDQLGHANISMTKHYVRNRIGKLVKPTK